MKTNTTLTLTHGNEWAKVSTLDGDHSLDVSIGNLLYDEEGHPYLLAFEEGLERRLYLEAR